MQIGLVLALFVTYACIENKTYDRNIGDLGSVTMNAEMEEETVITEVKEPVKPKTPPPPAPEKIEIVETFIPVINLKEAVEINLLTFDEADSIKTEKINYLIKENQEFSQHNIFHSILDFLAIKSWSIECLALVKTILQHQI